MKRRMWWLFDYFYFIYFLLHVEELNFCFQFFSFNCNFDFFYQWWQINKMWYYLWKNPDMHRWWWTDDYLWVAWKGFINSFDGYLQSLYYNFAAFSFMSFFLLISANLNHVFVMKPPHHRWLIIDYDSQIFAIAFL